MPRLAPVLACALALVGVTLLAAPARADLQGDAERLVQAWKGRGALVERLDPLFLERGRARSIAIAPRPIPPPEEGSGCLTVALLATRTVELTAAAEAMPGLLPPPRAPDPGLFAHGVEDDPRLKSGGGALVLSRCGVERAELSRVTVEVTSPRGTVEVVVARTLIPLGEVRDVLPERASGPSAPRGDPGGPIEPGPIAERLIRAERKARSDGAQRWSRTSARASVLGAGQIDLEVGEGCHRLELMAEVPAIVPRRITDVDAEARSADGRVLARDRADVPDARLDFCVGETTLIEVPFAGASGPVSMVLGHAEWPLPAQVPLRWGARARAGFASALLRRHGPDPAGPPLFETIGVGGVTAVPIAIEPGRCYLAAVALIRGDAKAIRFSAHLGDRSPHDAVERPEGSAFAFCADTDRSALLEVDVRGGAPWWALAVWQAGAATP